MMLKVGFVGKSVECVPGNSWFSSNLVPSLVSSDPADRVGVCVVILEAHSHRQVGVPQMPQPTFGS